MAHLVKTVPSLAVAIVLLALARYLFLRTTRIDIDKAILTQQNVAAGLVFGAYLLGVAVALSGIFFGRTQEAVMVRMGKVAVQGALIVILMRLTLFLNVSTHLLFTRVFSHTHTHTRMCVPMVSRVFCMRWLSHTNVIFHAFLSRAGVNAKFVC